MVMRFSNERRDQIGGNSYDLIARSELEKSQPTLHEEALRFVLLSTRQLDNCPAQLAACQASYSKIGVGEDFSASGIHPIKGPYFP